MPVTSQRTFRVCYSSRTGSSARGSSFSYTKSSSAATFPECSFVIRKVYGHFVFGAENKYLMALRDVLKEAVNDQYDYIDWWLYEATDDYTVWEADCTMKYCLKDPEALYDYITGTLKPVPVSSGESTSQQE